MPTLYEYFGIIIYFFSNDHLPVHVHVRTSNGKCKVIFDIRDGKIIRYDIYQVGKQPMITNDEMKKLQELLGAKSKDIIIKWKEFYIENKKIKPLRITRRLK